MMWSSSLSKHFNMGVSATGQQSLREKIVVFGHWYNCSSLRHDGTTACCSKVLKMFLPGVRFLQKVQRVLGLAVAFM